MFKCIFVTGCAGFIGSNFVLECLGKVAKRIINYDKLTYAGNLDNLAAVRDDVNHIFIQGDICNADIVLSLLRQYQPEAIVHFAAESHVDRSISEPGDFIKTNINGTFSMLEAARSYWLELSEANKASFRFLHISTDEVYGSLEPDEPPFAETRAYAPNSPYAASKAASDHLVRAYGRTYGLPVLITNCSNNYGPYQFPEKLIPLVIRNALVGKHLPIYGNGQQIRDWLYVADHCAGIRCVLETGKPGETYNMGGWNERTNLEVVQHICDLLDELRPHATMKSYRSLITFVRDRPGHDQRYAIDASKIHRELNWLPVETFESGIRKTVKWYLENQGWVERVTSGAYQDWVKRQYTA